MMERSQAVKCPDISTHLAGTKKVQQVLARPGVLERFFPDQPQVVQQIKETFAGLYTLDMVSKGNFYPIVLLVKYNKDVFLISFCLVVVLLSAGTRRRQNCSNGFGRTKPVCSETSARRRR